MGPKKSSPTLRKTKRRITQEVEEWEEACDDEPAEEPELDWGFLGDDKPPGHSIAIISDCTWQYLLCQWFTTLSQPPNVPTCDLSFIPFPIPRPWLLSIQQPGFAQQDVKDQDLQPITVESDDVKKELSKMNYPEQEGDLAPSAIAPKACLSIQKQVTKLEALAATFTGTEKKLSLLQSRMQVLCLVYFIFWDVVSNVSMSTNFEGLYRMKSMPWPDWVSTGKGMIVIVAICHYNNPECYN